MTADILVNRHSILGESVFWHPKKRKIFWVDIEGKKVHCSNHMNGETISFDTQERVGCIVPEESGTILMALENGISRLDTDTGITTHLLSIEERVEGKRFNDGKCDALGRFWVGSMSEQKGFGSLYCINPDLAYRKMLDKVKVSNGIIWSLNNEYMYYIDSLTRKVVRYEYNLINGAISNPQVLIRVPKSMGYPDGMTIDNQGNLWIALWGGSAVSKWNASTGELLKTISVPAPNVTSCAFGGENMNTLYITTAKKDLTNSESHQYPLSGGLFLAQLKIGGPKVSFFKNPV